ncbi:hypothetical protein [Virgibacillus proomii]|nr:hypothetical protein [Virgibacillus proomii]MBU5266313.1 hypothetical protein [Virgibacillus proomii]
MGDNTPICPIRLKFKDKKSLESDTSHAEKASFFFKDKKSLESDTS